MSGIGLKYKIIYVIFILTIIIVSSLTLVFLTGGFDGFNFNTEPIIETYHPNGTLSDPIQTSYFGFDGVAISSGFDTYELSPIANYEISGKVVGVAYYKNENLAVSPMDLCVVWGNMANRTDIVYTQGNRDCTFRATGSSLDIITHFSNSHIIPANDDILNKLQNVKVGDIVTIKGYLVNVKRTSSISSSTWTWISSTSRSDTGNNACEIIYVKGISIYR